VSPREIKYRNIAREILTNPCQSYTEIAHKTGILVDSPRQSIYQYLHNDRFKAIMAEEQPKYYDEKKLRRKLDTAIDATKPEQAVHKGYLELGMRSLGMLIDRTINENHNIDESELDKIRDKALIEAEAIVKNANILVDSESRSLIEVGTDIKDNANAPQAQDSASK
jgi:hypothetical protein